MINSVARVPALQRPSAGRWSSHCHHSSSLLATHRLLHSINRPPLISHRKYAQTPLYKPVRVKLEMKETVKAVEIQVTPTRASHPTPPKNKINQNKKLMRTQRLLPCLPSCSSANRSSSVLASPCRRIKHRRRLSFTVDGRAAYSGSPSPSCNDQYRALHFMEQGVNLFNYATDSSILL